LPNEKLIPVSPSEEKLIKLIRETNWGEITVKIKDRQPVMVYKIREDINLTI